MLKFNFEAKALTQRTTLSSERNLIFQLCSQLGPLELALKKFSLSSTHKRNGKVDFISWKEGEREKTANE